MKPLLFALLLLYNVGCDDSSSELPDPEHNSNSIETSVVEDQIDPAIEAPQNNNPGEIIFKAKVVDIYNSEKDICGVSRQNVMLIEVTEIVKRGLGITNVPHPKDQLFVSFVLAPKDVRQNSIIEAVAKESLCYDASQTFFTINSHKILE